MEPFPVYTVALEPEQEGPSLSGACCATLRLCGPHRAEHPRGPEGKERGVQRPGFGHGGGGVGFPGAVPMCVVLRPRGTG